MPNSGTLGEAHYEIHHAEGTTTVCVTRDYPAGLLPTAAHRVWEIVADFGGVKTIFPALVRVNLTYPDAADTEVKIVRGMTFAPPDPKKPLSDTNPLLFGVEQLVELDRRARRLAYVSVLGLPVKNYRSVMEVSGDDAATLTWTSTFTPSSGPAGGGFAEQLVKILGGGANQIATALAKGV